MYVIIITFYGLCLWKVNPMAKKPVGLFKYSGLTRICGAEARRLRPLLQPELQER
jgi:hypothetical protein